MSSFKLLKVLSIIITVPGFLIFSQILFAESPTATSIVIEEKILINDEMDEGSNIFINEPVNIADIPLIIILPTPTPVPTKKVTKMPPIQLKKEQIKKETQQPPKAYDEKYSKTKSFRDRVASFFKNPFKRKSKPTPTPVKKTKQTPFDRGTGSVNNEMDAGTGSCNLASPYEGLIMMSSFFIPVVFRYRKIRRKIRHF